MLCEVRPCQAYRLLHSKAKIPYFVGHRGIAHLLLWPVLLSQLLDLYLHLYQQKVSLLTYLAAVYPQDVIMSDTSISTAVSLCKSTWNGDGLQIDRQPQKVSVGGGQRDSASRVSTVPSHPFPLLRRSTLQKPKKPTANEPVTFTRQSSVGLSSFPPCMSRASRIPLIQHSS